MKVKVLVFKDYDYGNIMDTYVFKEEADLEEIKHTVEYTYDVVEEGQRPYCDIIRELYGHLMLNVIEEKEIDW